MYTSYQSYTEALSMACQAFEEHHPQHPPWLKYYMSLSITKNQCQQWVISFLLFPQKIRTAGEGLQWFEDGTSLPCSIDTKTNQTYITLCDGPPPEPEIFFSVAIDSNNTIHIQKDTPLHTLHRENYAYNTMQQWW